MIRYPVAPSGDVRPPQPPAPETLQPTPQVRAEPIPEPVPIAAGPVSPSVLAKPRWSLSDWAIVSVLPVAILIGVGYAARTWHAPVSGPTSHGKPSATVPATESPSAPPKPLAANPEAAAAGLAYRKEADAAFAASLVTGGQAIASGTPIEQAISDHQARAKKARSDAWNTRLGPILDKIIPSGTAESAITAEQRKRYSDALISAGSGGL